MILGCPWKRSIHDRPAYRTYPTCLYRAEMIHLETVFDKTIKSINIFMYMEMNIVIDTKKIYMYIWVIVLKYVRMGLILLCVLIWLCVSCILVFLYVIDINGLWITNLSYASVVWGWWEKMTTELHLFCFRAFPEYRKFRASGAGFLLGSFLGSTLNFECVVLDFVIMLCWWIRMLEEMLEKC